MKTVFASLPFYDSLAKQDVERSKAIIPIHCPRTQLPPFQWNAETADYGDVVSIKLIDKDGVEASGLGRDYTNFSSWTNGDYGVFTSTGLNITAATSGTGGGAAVVTQTYTAYAGEKIMIRGYLTIAAGTAPYVGIVGEVSQQLSAGYNEIAITAQAAGVKTLLIATIGAGSCSFTNVTIGTGQVETIMSTLPTATVWSTNTYGIYNGDTLNYLLPLGLYYIKITTENDFVLYSDWIMIQNIYENLITSFSKDLYETFTTDGTRIISAIETGVSGTGISNNFSVKTGETITVYLYLTQNSGDEPSVNIHSNTFGGYISNAVQLSAGLNVVTLVTTNNDDDAFLNFYSTSASNFSTSEVWVQRTYSPHFIQLAFKNTNNLGNIFYDGTFEQKVWLDSVMGTPTHETITFGEEKNGEFIAEKLISKYIYSIIAYVSRSLYQCLSRLPLHDTITITDEVGDTYSPAVGNVTVEQPEWIGFETCKLTIKFNDGENSNFVWTK